MKGLVLDASVLLRWVLEGEIPVLAVSVRELMQQQYEALAPDLLPWEVMNAIVMSDRNNTLGHPFDYACQQAAAWLALVHIEPGAQTPLAASAALARQYRLTAYDAGYLELALRQNLPLATLDQQLYRAAVAAGVAVDF